MAVLDTSFLIDLERDSHDAWGLLETLTQSREHLRVPAAVWVEYLCAMRPEPRERAIAELEAAVTFEPFTREFADEAIIIQQELALRGALLGWHDLQVAATARWHREGVVTRDAGFRNVAGLRVHAW